MKITPKSASEVATAGLLPAGVYDCEVVEAEETVSSKGNDMIKMRVKVYTEDGSSRTLFDYLLDSVAYKVRHAAESFGLMEAYDAGELSAIDLQGRTGRCKVRIDPAKDGYEAKNSIQDYVVGTEVIAKRVAQTVAASRAPGGGTIDGDEIPFSPCWQ